MSAGPGDLLSIKQVAERLSMSESFVRRHLDKFPETHLIGGHWRITRRSVDRYLEKCRKSSYELTKHSSA